MLIVPFTNTKVKKLFSTMNSRGQINEKYSHCKNFVSEASFATPLQVRDFFKCSIVICINCIGKMLIWGHFHGIMELLLNNYLGHSNILILVKTFVFLIIESAIKPTPLLHANFQMTRHTKCNRSYWWQPECFYEPESPVTTPKSGQPKLPVHNIHWSYEWCASMLGQINLQLIELGCSRRLTGNCTIMNN